MQQFLNQILVPLFRRTLHPLTSVQNYPESRISPFFRVNGYPPLSAYPQAKGDDDTYERLLADRFRDYRLEVHGLVKQPLRLSLEDLRALPKRQQVTMHHCVQGWSSIGKWGGVPVEHILELCSPLPQARYLAFVSFGMHEGTGRRFYECLDLKTARAPQTLLAYELNDHTLPVQHGAPLRLRVETCLGYKMVKYLKSIELIEDYRHIGGGMGGVREDEQLFEVMSHI
jgi:DMSO/TMAO reductase YedYZ molybdopterin-dependent catalytic subunit